MCGVVWWVEWKGSSVIRSVVERVHVVMSVDMIGSRLSFLSYEVGGTVRPVPPIPAAAGQSINRSSFLSNRRHSQVKPPPPPPIPAAAPPSTR